MRAPEVTTVDQRLDGSPDMDPHERLAKLHADHAAALLRFLRSYSRDRPQAAEDMLQETMIRAWRHIDTVPLEYTNARRWLYTVARRIAIDAARVRKTHPIEVSLPETDWTLPAEDTADQTVAAQSIMTAFQKLTLEQQTVLSELHLRGNSVASIAERLGIPTGTVKSRAHYALRSMRASLELPG
jgi:RNA polymerase sigma-70 factor, ECF subfamily